LFGAKAVDLTSEITVEATGSPAKLAALLDLLEPTEFASSYSPPCCFGTRQSITHRSQPAQRPARAVSADNRVLSFVKGGFQPTSQTPRCRFHHHHSPKENHEVPAEMFYDGDADCHDPAAMLPC
jgi:hypothetical protein